MTNDAPLPQGGILLIDKAEGWTSHDAVARVRRALGTRKVGHAGTLDPMATGLLILGYGPSTRLLTHLVGLDKTYLATIRLGVSTVTDDREGDRTAVAGPGLLERVDPASVEAALHDLRGPIMQAPSAVSAIKVDGRRAYDRVRAGEEVRLAERAVTIHSFEVGEPRTVEEADGVPAIDLTATVRCSSGTYVRALARDLGAALGVGGHLTSLRRTEVGPFGVDDAIGIEALAAGDPVRPLAPADVARRLFPVLALDDAEAVDLGNGKRLDVGSDRCSDAPLVAAISGDDRLVGLVEVARGRTRVVTNFPAQSSAGPA